MIKIKKMNALMQAVIAVATAKYRQKTGKLTFELHLSIWLCVCVCVAYRCVGTTTDLCYRISIVMEQSWLRG